MSVESVRIPAPSEARAEPPPLHVEAPAQPAAQAGGKPPAKAANKRQVSVKRAEKGNAKPKAEKPRQRAQSAAGPARGKSPEVPVAADKAVASSERAKGQEATKPTASVTAKTEYTINTAYNGDLGPSLTPQFTWKRGTETHTHPALADIRTAHQYFMLRQLAIAYTRLFRADRIPVHLYDVGGSAGFAYKAEEYFAKRGLPIKVWTSRPLLEPADAPRVLAMADRATRCSCICGQSTRDWCCEAYANFSLTSQLFAVVSTHCFYYLQTPSAIRELRHATSRSIMQRSFHIVHPIRAGEQKGSIAEATYSVTPSGVSFTIRDTIKVYSHPPIMGDNGFWGSGERQFEFPAYADGPPANIDELVADLEIGILHRAPPPVDGAAGTGKQSELGLHGDFEWPLKDGDGKTASVILLMTCTHKVLEHQPEQVENQTAAPPGFEPWLGEGESEGTIAGYTLQDGILTVYTSDKDAPKDRWHAGLRVGGSVNFHAVSRTVNATVDMNAIRDVTTRLSYLDSRIRTALKQSSAAVKGEEMLLTIVCKDLLNEQMVNMLAQDTELVAKATKAEPEEVRSARWFNTFWLLRPWGAHYTGRNQFKFGGLSNRCVIALALMVAALLLVTTTAIVASRLSRGVAKHQSLVAPKPQGPASRGALSEETTNSSPKDQAAAKNKNKTVSANSPSARVSEDQAAAKTVSASSPTVLLGQVDEPHHYVEHAHEEYEWDVGRAGADPAPILGPTVSAFGVSRRGRELLSFEEDWENALRMQREVEEAVELVVEETGLSTPALVGLWLLLSVAYYALMRALTGLLRLNLLVTIAGLSLLLLGAGRVLWAFVSGADAYTVLRQEQLLMAAFVLLGTVCWNLAIDWTFRTFMILELATGAGVAMVVYGVTLMYAAPVQAAREIVAWTTAELAFCAIFLVALCLLGVAVSSNVRLRRRGVRRVNTVCVATRESNRKPACETFKRAPRNLSLKYRIYVNPETIPSEEKIGARCGVGSVTIQGSEFVPIVGGNTGHNMAVAVDERISKMQEGMTDNGRSEYLRENWGDVREWLTRSGLLADWQSRPLPNPPVAEWWDKQLPSRQKVMEPAVLQLFGSVERFRSMLCQEVNADLSEQEWAAVLKTDLFVKREAAIKQEGDYKPRAIQNPTPASKVLFGPHAFCVDKWLKMTFDPGNHVTYAGGLNGEDLGRWVDESVGAFDQPLILENDMSCFEGSITTEALEMEAWIFGQLGAADFMLEFMRRDVRQNGCARGIFSYSIEGGRKSGRNNTSCGNSLLNACATLYALFHLTDSEGRISDDGELSEDFGCQQFSRPQILRGTSRMQLMSRSIFMGDDNLIFVEPTMFNREKVTSEFFGRAFVAIFARLGFNSTMAIRKHYAEASFCGTHFIDTSSGIMPAPIFPRQILKMAWCTSNQQGVDYWEWLRGVCGQMSAPLAHVPVLRVYIRRLTELVGQGPSVALQYKPFCEERHHCTTDGMCDFCDFFQISLGDVYSMEAYLEEWDPTTPLDHPVISELCARFAELETVSYSPPHTVLEGGN